MRIYDNIDMALNEIKREMAEMSTVVPLYSMQDKIVEGNTDFDTKELIGYSYMLIGVTSKEMKEYFEKNKLNWDYVEVEIRERTSGNPINPGTSFMLRQEVWNQFLHEGRFQYTYPERFAPNIAKIIKELIEHPTTRQAILSVWESEIDVENIGGKARVPCSLQYQFLRRDGILIMIYSQRSCDALTHLPYDLALAIKLQEFIAKTIGVKPGRFIHQVGSMHCYRKDVKDIF